jgi:hypothetical protein
VTLPAAGEARARAEAHGCAAVQGGTLREGNNHTRWVLSVIHPARTGGRRVREMARIAV